MRFTLPSPLISAMSAFFIKIETNVTNDMAVTDLVGLAGAGLDLLDVTCTLFTK